MKPSGISSTWASTDTSNYGKFPGSAPEQPPEPGPEMGEDHGMESRPGRFPPL